jgi:phenylalanyl-tRNA synthetase alpha chain
LIDDIRAARDAALERIATSATLQDVATLATELLGKRGSLAQLKTRLGSLATVDEKKAAGQALNEATDEANTALEARRSELAAGERASQVEAERLDLTEYAGKPTRGRAHLVTQAWERLEDVFVGLGFQVAEGPEVETDWFNFESLNMGEGHPARSDFDTLFVDHAGAPPGTTVLRTHTSPVQMRTMLAGPPPIYIVAPGRVFRRDTPDATQMPVFHQIDGLVVDRGISLAHLAGTI